MPHPPARVALLCLCLALPLAARAHDGEPRTGAAFTSAAITTVRPPQQRTPFRAATLHEVLFRSGEHLTGAILSLDERTLRLRTAWMSDLHIPRHALAAVTHFSGAVTFHEEDFEKDPPGWKRPDSVALSDRQHTSGRRSLCLDTPGQEATFTLPQPLAAGRAEINFYDPGPMTDRRWRFIAEFVSPQRKQGMDSPLLALRAGIDLAGAGESYTVETPLAAERAAPTARTPGWHRLSLRFAPGYLIVGVDEATVWASAKAGPGGALRKIQLRCEAADGEANAARAAAYFDDFSLARTLLTPARRAADPRQDDVWLVSGDQWFGRVRGADRHTIRLDTRFGAQTLAWGEVRGIYFRPMPAPARPTSGERVRLRFHPGRGAKLDELEATVIALDEQHVRLRHADLGELEIDRARIQEPRRLSPRGD